MEAFKGINYDAVGIEHDFAIFFGHRIGDRNTSHDADLFRGGNIARLGENVTNICDHLELRLSRFSFHPDEENAGGAKARLDVAIRAMKRVAETMQQSTEGEPQDYHWLIISDLALIIGSLLDHIEGTGHSLG